jgi:hypothetical protein
MQFFGNGNPLAIVQSPEPGSSRRKFIGEAAGELSQDAGEDE